jgi:hypothetical protein
MMSQITGPMCLISCVEAISPYKARLKLLIQSGGSIGVYYSIFSDVGCAVNHVPFTYFPITCPGHPCPSHPCPSHPCPGHPCPGHPCPGRLCPSYLCCAVTHVPFTYFPITCPSHPCPGHPWIIGAVRQQAKVILWRR